MLRLEDPYLQAHLGLVDTVKGSVTFGTIDVILFDPVSGTYTGEVLTAVPIVYGTGLGAKTPLAEARAIGLHFAVTTSRDHLQVMSHARSHAPAVHACAIPL